MSVAVIILLIISGLAGVTLTVWGRVMPPETAATKRGFVAVGAVSAICIVVAGILNAATQDSLKRVIETMSENVQKLAEPANVRKNLSVYEILAAAASKLRDQDVEIQKLQSEVKGITHPNDAFYLNNVIVARTLGTTQQTDTDVIFQLIIAGQDGLDFDKEFQYQSLTLKCRPPGVYGGSGSFGVMEMRYPGVKCEIKR
jgi:hypothetical protein